MTSLWLGIMAGTANTSLKSFQVLTHAAAGFGIEQDVAGFDELHAQAQIHIRDEVVLLIVVAVENEAAYLVAGVQVEVAAAAPPEVARVEILPVVDDKQLIHEG